MLHDLKCHENIEKLLLVSDLERRALATWAERHSGDSYARGDTTFFLSFNSQIRTHIIVFILILLKTLNISPVSQMAGPADGSSTDYA